MLVTFGEALVDLIPPSGISLSAAQNLHIQPGGAPLNVAVALRRLGSSSRFCGTLSTDAFGTRLAELIVREDVDHEPPEPVDRPTRLALVDHGPQGSTFRFYGDDPADLQLSRRAIDRALRGGVRGLYLGSLMMANEKGRAAQEYAVERAQSLDIPIIVDPNPRPPAWPDRDAMRDACTWLIRRATLVKLSLDDARLLGFGESPNDVLTNRAFAVETVVTDGARGSWSLIDGEIVHVRGPRVEAIDPTGAGDAFFAGLITRYLVEDRVTEAGLRFAAATGALATTRAGAIDALPTLREVQALQKRA